MRNWLLALVTVAVWLLAADVNRGPMPQGLETPRDMFSAARAKAALTRFEGPALPHPAGSVENRRIHDRLHQELASMGVAVESLAARQCYGESRWPAIECADVTDLIASVMPGDGKAVILMAHMDSVPAGPGAGDDGSGVATLLETIRALKAAKSPSRHPVLALFTDGEEAGLLGAEAFVKNPYWREQVGVVINVESRGSDGQSLLFQTSPGDAKLIDIYARNAPRVATSSLYDEIYKALPNDTDLTPFLKAGLTGYNFGFVGGVAHYHTALDTIQNLDPRSLQSGGDGVLALTRALMNENFAALASGNAIYLDLMGVGLPRLPASWALPLAVAALLVIAVLAWRRKPALWSLLTPPLFLVAAVAAGFALKALAALVSGHADPAYAQPLVLRLALALSVWTLALFAARRAGTLGCWLWFALLAVASARFLPGLSPYFLFPSLIAALALPFGLAWLPALASLVIWIQLTAEAEPLMGLAVTPLFTVPAAMGLLTLLPLLQPSRVQARICASVTVLLAIAAGFVPAYDAGHPQRLNFRYVEADGQASWVADPVRPLPDAVRAAMPFSRELKIVAGDAAWRGYVADAGHARLPAPAATVIRSGADVILKLHGSREADGMTLTVPAEAGLERIALDDQSVPVTGPPRRMLINCASPGCRDATITLTRRGTRPLALLLSEQRHGLPPDGEKLSRARGALGVPSQSGDGVELVSRVQID